MLLQEPVADNVWRLLEESFLDCAGKAATNKYACLSETEKRPVLIDFAKNQAVSSQRWASIVQNLLSADLKP
jgi:hypothetical protein